MQKLKGRRNGIWQKKEILEGELLKKYTVKMLYRWNNGKFENEYLERNW